MKESKEEEKTYKKPLEKSVEKDEDTEKMIKLNVWKRSKWDANTRKIRHTSEHKKKTIKEVPERWSTEEKINRKAIKK